MNGKRIVIPKNTGSKCNGKLKDMLSTSRQKSEAESSIIANIPLIKQCDNSKFLPRYTSVLNRSAEDGVIMDDLDQLQQDLEKLLSVSACRSRFLLSELESLDKVEENRDKKDKYTDKTPLKRKRPDEKIKYKDIKSGNRVVKKNYGIPVNNFLADGHLRHELPKVSLPKNDNSDKFWASIEPYCTNVSNDDLAFLDSLMDDFSKETNVKIPEIGDHYAHEWSEELLNDEQNLGRSPKSKPSQNMDIKKYGLSALVDTFSSPHAGVCMDKKLEQGILNLDEIKKNRGEDEILSEIKKCQQELKSINQYNLEELNKLKLVVQSDLQKQQVKEELEKIDNQVLDLYNKVLMAKKQTQQIDGDEFDKSLFTKQLTSDFESQADQILKQQIVLHTWAYPEYNPSVNSDQYYANINQ